MDNANTQTAVKSRAQPLLDLRPKFVYGLTTGVAGNCLYLNDHTIVYPVSGVIVVYDMDTHSQKLIKLEDPRRIITAMDLNVINHVLAVATIRGDDYATGGSDGDVDKPTISIYDVTSLDLKCVFVEPDSVDGDDNNEDDDDVGVSRTSKDRKPSRYFRRVRYLYDKMFVAALAMNDDGSDCSMYYYRWRNSTVDTRVRIDGHVADMASNPIDTSICCFVGKDLFQLMTRIDEDWTQYGFREANGIDFTCVCWLCGDRCLAGTSDGIVVLFKNGVLQAWYQVDVLRDLDVTVMQTEDEMPKHNDETGLSRSTKIIRKCFTSLYGLFLVVGDSVIYYFEKMDEGRRFVRKTVLVKREDRYLQSQTTSTGQPKHFVESAYASPNGEKLVCVTKRGQLYWTQLHGVGDGFNTIVDNVDEIDVKDDDYDEENGEENKREKEDDDRQPLVASPAATEVEVQPLGEHLHCGQVRCLSASLWKPTFMTCGATDFTIKVWDYAECTLLLSKHYPREVRSVSIHPTGLFSIAAFSDYVEYQMIESDDLVPLKYYTISGCTECAFSRSGHMFALAKLDAIDVYCSVLFEKRFSCLGNPQAFVKILLWTNDDANIVAYDSIGNLCTFDTKTGKLLAHVYMYSMASHADVAVTTDVERMFMTAKDGLLTELYNKKVVRELNLHHGPLFAICISSSNSTLFIASKNGVIMTIVLPILYQVEFKEYKIHNHNVTKICSVPDESTLITCAEDGSMCIWKVTDLTNKTNEPADNHFAYTDDILINWSKYLNMVHNAEKLETTVRRLETESAQAIDRLKSSNEKQIETTETTNAALCREMDENNKARVEAQKSAICELENELRALRETNEQVAVNLDMEFHGRLVPEYAGNLILQNQASAAATESKKNLKTLRQTVDDELLETARVYEEKVKDKDEDILMSKNKLIDENNCLIMLMGTVEDDCDRKVLKKNREYAVKLKTMEELYLRTIREADEFKLKQKLYTIANTDLNNLVESLEADIETLKKSTLDKNNKITGLMRLLKQFNEVDVQKTAKIQITVKQLVKLEKELDLLSEDIVSLEQTTEHLILEIQKQQEQIEEYEVENDNATKTLKGLDLELVVLKEQKNESVDELEREKLVVQDQSNFINQLKVDMYSTSKHHQSRNVKEANEKVIQFFGKYVGPTAQHTHVPDDEELEARVELARQRKYLETYIDGLKNTIKSYTTRNESYYLVLEENIKLIEEIKALRKVAKMFGTSSKSNNFKCTAPDKRLVIVDTILHDDDDDTWSSLGDCIEVVDNFETMTE